MYNVHTTLATRITPWHREPPTHHMLAGEEPCRVAGQHNFSFGRSGLSPDGKREVEVQLEYGPNIFQYAMQTYSVLYIIWCHAIS